MESETDTTYDHMEYLIIMNSEATLNTRRLLRKAVNELENECRLEFEVHGVTFEIIKHVKVLNEDTEDEVVIDTYDIDILRDKTYLTEEEKHELYDTMYSAIVERDPEDERLSEMHFETFEGIYLKKRIEDYLLDGETGDFYKYVEDHIYETVCNE